MIKWIPHATRVVLGEETAYRQPTWNLEQQQQYWVPSEKQALERDQAQPDRKFIAEG